MRENVAAPTVLPLSQTGKIVTKQELLQIAKPMPFTTEMVRAILDDRKGVTRRKVKQDTSAALNGPARLKLTDVPDSVFIKKLCLAPCEVGDVLYVQEIWQEKPAEIGGGYFYEEIAAKQSDNYSWQSPKCMPKDAARIFLRVTNITVERLQDITEEQCEKEGMTEKQKNSLAKEEYWYWFKELWNSTIKKSDLDTYGWNANPWVWVIEFERVNCMLTKSDGKGNRSIDGVDFTQINGATYVALCKLLEYECSGLSPYAIGEVVRERAARAHWYDRGSLSCRCSACGGKSNKESAFCPNCGARMDLEEEK